ncbi:MAG TPA: hypothetical protein VI456_00395 [Polyangia bacterium]
MKRRLPFAPAALLSGLAALGWFVFPGCGGGSPKSDGGAGAGGHPNAGAPGGAGGGRAGASGAAGGSAAAGAAGTGIAGAGMAGAGGGAGSAAGGAAGTGVAGTSGGGSGGSAGSSPDAGGCTTSVAVGNRLLYGFDGGNVGDWMSDLDGVPADAGPPWSISWSADGGHTCPGVLQLPGSPVPAGVSTANVIFMPAANWSGFSRMHLWARIQTSDFSAIGSLYLYVQADAFAHEAAQYVQIAGSVFTDGGFHEMVVDLTTFSAQDLAGVDKIALQMQLASPAADAGTATPQTTLSIDDVWLEAAAASDAASSN